MDERITLLIANACGTGAATGLAVLCKSLAATGVLSAAEIENIRHAAVLGFDRTRLHKDLSPEESALFEQARVHLDGLWQSAALEAERPS